METSKEDQGHLDELFNKARQEKPLVSYNEVKSILPLAGLPAIHSAGKGFHFSISSIVVGTGILVSSILSYMVLKVDRHDASAKKEVAQQVTPVAPSNHIETTKSNEVAAPVQQSTQKQNLLTSTDKKLIALPENEYKKVVLNEENAPGQKITATYSLKQNDKEYNIIMEGTDVISIEVDGIKVSSEEYSQHAEAIAIAKNFAEDNIKEQNVKQYLMNMVDKNLRADKLPADENHYVFLLTSSKLYIDGVPQDEKAFTRYSQLYKEQTGKELAGDNEYEFKMHRKQLINKDVYGYKTK
jgi:hypothetical protein